MNSDYLDQFCEEEFGHLDWERTWDKEGNMVVTFYKEARLEFLEEMDEEDREPTILVHMRKDLAEDGVLIPAGKSYKDYDDLQEITHLSAEDMKGAVEYDTGEDPDSHAFCPVKLADGRVFYMIGVDLDWERV
jgi:hypothetical protein